MIIVTRLVFPGFSAFSFWPFIFVRPGMRDDVSLIEHELVHYREQRWITAWWVARYLLSRRFRLAAEVRAYQRQIAMCAITREDAANLLLHYRLGITYAQALAALQ